METQVYQGFQIRNVDISNLDEKTKELVTLFKPKANPNASPNDPTRLSDEAVWKHILSGDMMDRKGKADLKKILRHGIDSKRRDLVVWFFSLCCKWEKSKKILFKSVEQVFEELGKAEELFKYDITSIHHVMNEFLAVGIVQRSLQKNVYKYWLSDDSKKYGADYMLKGNKWFEGLIVTGGERLIAFK